MANVDSLFHPADKKGNVVGWVYLVVHVAMVAIGLTIAGLNEKANNTHLDESKALVIVVTIAAGAVSVLLCVKAFWKGLLQDKADSFVDVAPHLLVNLITAVYGLVNRVEKEDVYCDFYALGLNVAILYATHALCLVYRKRSSVSTPVNLEMTGKSSKLTKTDNVLLLPVSA